MRLVKSDEKDIRASRHYLEICFSLFQREDEALQRVKQCSENSVRFLTDPHEELRRIQEALQKLKDGRFGYCEKCDASIAPELLWLDPCQRFCHARCRSKHRVGAAAQVSKEVV